MSAFKWRQFADEVILWAVRWYSGSELFLTPDHGGSFQGFRAFGSDPSFT